MHKNEPIHIKSKSSPLNLTLRNKELAILLGTSLISLLLTTVTILGYFSLLLFSFVVLFIGIKRGRFVSSNLEYVVFKEHVELYRGGELYRNYKLQNSSIGIERTPFGINIVFKKNISHYFESDSVFGFVNDLGKGSYEFLIYNCPEHDKVIAFLND